MQLTTLHRKQFYVTKFLKSSHNSRFFVTTHSGAAKSLARPGRKQATATEDFEFHISYL